MFLWHWAAPVFMQSPAFQGMLIKIVERENTNLDAVIEPSGKRHGCKSMPSDPKQSNCHMQSFQPGT